MSKVKEEERIERIIRNLLKMPGNRRCINCNSLGPQYVCTTFWTFVCTNCSGIHREFMHRVKSVSVAKFNAEEIDALQTGGNERARQIYFKEWDPQRFPLPDSNLISQNRIRDFIKHVYVDRKFTGERSMERQSMIKERIKEELSKWPSFEKPGRRERFEDKSDVCYLEQERNHNENFPRVRPNVLRTHSCNFEIVDDRVRDDRRSEIRRISSLESTKTSIGSQSTGSQTNRKTFNPSVVVRPFKDIVGAVHEPRRLVKPDSNISSRGQTRLTSSSSGSMSGKQSPQTIVNLMDFGYEPEPVGPQTQEDTKSSETDNGTSGQSSMKKVSDIPGSSNFESLLFAFSDPITPADTASALHNASDTATTSKATNITATKSMPCFQSTNYWDLPVLPAKSNSISRQELPEDLFSSSYANWQGVHPYSNYTHNNYTMPVATSSNSTESRNPFDLDDDDILAHNSVHNSAPASSQFMQQQYYPSLSPPQSSYSEMQSSAGTIKGQQLPSGTVFLSGGEAVFGSWDGNQPFAGDYQLNSANPTSFPSTKGNPFM